MGCPAEDAPSAGTPGVAVVGLVRRYRAPRHATPRTRSDVPRGYGVREQCLPFTAAAAVGLTIPAPFTWGCCRGDDAPPGARTFRSPVEGSSDERVLYVVDEPEHHFVGNQYEVTDDVARRAGPAPVPGLSFFHRADQAGLVKVHLPYVWRTDPGVALLICEPLNRIRTDGLRVLAGLVETAWYSNPVNLVLQLPPAPGSVHVRADEPLAQAIPLHESQRRPPLDHVAPHRRDAREVLADVRTVRDSLDRDRSAYRRAARSSLGRMVHPDDTG